MYKLLSIHHDNGKTTYDIFTESEWPKMKYTENCEINNASVYVDTLDEMDLDEMVKGLKQEKAVRVCLKIK